MPAKRDYLRGAVPQTERERVLLNQIGWVRHMLARMYAIWPEADPRLRSSMIATLHSIKRNHPCLKQFYQTAPTCKASAAAR